MSETISSYQKDNSKIPYESIIKEKVKCDDARILIVDFDRKNEKHMEELEIRLTGQCRWNENMKKSGWFSNLFGRKYARDDPRENQKPNLIIITDKKYSDDKKFINFLNEHVKIPIYVQSGELPFQELVFIMSHFIELSKINLIQKDRNTYYKRGYYDGKLRNLCSPNDHFVSTFSKPQIGHTYFKNIDREKFEEMSDLEKSYIIGFKDGIKSFLHKQHRNKKVMFK